MIRDDELTALTERVRQAFGDLAVSEAYLRAMTSTPASGFAARVVEDQDDEGMDGRDTAAALKAELRRLLTAH